MTTPAPDAQQLRGKTVAFTGRLASMTRAKAAELVRAYGGIWTSSVTRGTSLVVVGQEGWPLRKDGRLSLKLQKARRLQHRQRIEVISEADLLARLGIDSAIGRQLFSTAQLSQVLKVPGERIRRWVEFGLLTPSETAHGLHHFDFREAAWARSLGDLIQAGITARRIRHSLEQLARWLPEVDKSLAQLAVLEKNGQLQVRLQEGRLFEPTGQGLFDFDEQQVSPTVPVATTQATAEDWFDAACAHEDAGELTEAARAYRQALLMGGPDRDASFNLANVLYNLGCKEQAAERYRQALEVDLEFVEAWNNLGNVLAELGETEEAISAFERALQCDADYTDVHYNLADVLEQAGRATEANAHWRAYLACDPASRWADYARGRLRARK